MAMADKVIAVAGATGAQGGAVVDALLAQGAFKVRALTRNIESESAKKLAAKGCEVVKCDLDAPETLPAAFKGCHGAFLVTNFWEHCDAQREIRQACAAADAAAAAGVAHIVWSSLEDTRPALGQHPDVPTVGGVWKVPHLDAKWEATQYMEGKGYPVTSLITSCFCENFVTVMKPHKTPDGTHVMALPDLGGAAVPFVSVADIGRAAAALFKKGYEPSHKVVGIVGDYITLPDAVRVLAEVGGKAIAFNGMPYAAYQAMLAQFMPEEGALEMTNMWRYYGYTPEVVASHRPLDAARALVPEVASFRQWAEAHKQELLAVLA